MMSAKIAVGAGRINPLTENNRTAASQITSSVTNIATFTFDADGNELTAANANGTYTMSYDALGRATVVNELGLATRTRLRADLA